MMMTLDCPQITGKLQVKKKQNTTRGLFSLLWFAVSKMRISKNNNTENINIKKIKKTTTNLYE